MCCCRENKELQEADYNYRRNLTQTERQSTYDKKNLLRTQRKKHQQDFASKEKADKLAFKEQVCQIEQHLCNVMSGCGLGGIKGTGGAETAARKLSESQTGQNGCKESW